jgi:septum site-determining protein MinD
MGTAIVVTSGKGGTGKTTVTAGVASCLAALGKKTVAVDADIGLRNLDIVIGRSDRVIMDFYDVMETRCSLADAIVSHPAVENLSILAAPVTASPQDIDPSGFNELIIRLKEEYDYCFIDCAAGLDTSFKLATGAADSAIVVSNTELLSLRDAARVSALLFEAGIEDVKLVVNRVRPYMVEHNEASNIDEAMDMTGLPLLGIVPEDETVIACANHASLVILQGRTEAGQGFLDIARRICGETVSLQKKIKVSPSRYDERKQ